MNGKAKGPCSVGLINLMARSHENSVTRGVEREILKSRASRLIEDSFKGMATALTAYRCRNCGCIDTHEPREACACGHLNAARDRVLVLMDDHTNDRREYDV